MEDGPIQIDSNYGKRLGFTSKKFMGYSYLWKIEDKIYLSLIESKEKNKGTLTELFGNISALGFRIAVPNPLPLMEKILLKGGFSKTMEDDSEVWIKS